ncbi:MAG: PepSY domain-containing protein [Planctomycetaceae bacterium]|jgi:uncharacterized iron-regulated membrane protein|nr:PepSY domain-containing protein [Planctomycetaceae bacterium]
MVSFNFFRRIFYEIHLWLGILCGIVVFLVCFSGSMLVFREEINRFLDPGKYYVSVPADGQRLPIDELITRVESKTSGMKVTSLTIPEKKNRTMLVSLSRPMPEGERGGFGGGERGSRGGQGGGERGERSGFGNRGERGGQGGQQGGGERNTWQGRQRGQQGEGQQGGERNGFSGFGGNREGAGGREFAGNRGGQNGGERGGVSGGNRGGQGGGRGGSGGRGQGWYVNPYTGDIVAKPGDGVSLNRFFMSMTQLHRNLWISYRIEQLGPRSSLGSLIVGVATLIFVVVMLSGLVLWLPRTWQSFLKWRAWKPGFKVRFRKGFWCFIHDLHNTVGFYCLIPLLILALTGLCWSFGWYRSAASYVLGEQVLNRQRVQRSEKIAPVDENTKPLPLEEMIEHLNKLIPSSGEITLAIPNDRESPMTIQKGKTGFFALSVKDKTLWDRFRGTVIPIEHYGKTVEVERLTDKPIGTQIASTIRALHFGEITGISSKIVFFVACVFAMTFPITGVALWTRKLVEYYRKRRNAKNSQQQEQTPSTIDIEHPLNNTTSVNTGQTV